MGSKNSKNTSFTEISLEEDCLKMQNCSKFDFGLHKKNDFHCKYNHVNIISK